jgi:hypothetical protein
MTSGEGNGSGDDGNAPDLDSAVEVSRVASHFGDPTDMRIERARILLHRFAENSQGADLDSAIDLLDSTHSTTDPRDPTALEAVDELLGALHLRYEIRSRPEDLDRIREVESFRLGLQRLESPGESDLSIPDAQPQPPGPPPFVVSRLVPEIDPPDTPDHLGIEADARALATFLALVRVQPPVALAIYGPWGSGKTFFMRRIEREVKALQGQPGQDSARVFEHGIAHVWFNAWHYADSNLWASLVSRIFAALHPAPSEREERLAHVLANIEGAQQIQETLTRRLADATDQRELAEAAVAKARTNLAQATEQAAEIKARDL